MLVTYTNDEGPIANSSIIDASKLGEQLPSCLFTFLCLPFICLHFLFTFLGLYGSASSVTVAEFAQHPQVTYMASILSQVSQLFVYIFIVIVYIPKLEGLIILTYYSNNYHGIVYNILNS